MLKMADRFVSNQNLIAEITRSKATYCNFTEAAYAAFDTAVDSLAETQTTPIGSVVRVHTWEHIPLAAKPNSRLRGEAKHRESVNFKPFKHYLMTNEGPIEVGRSHWRGDFVTGNFSVHRGKLTDKLAMMIMAVTQNLSMRGSFRNYSYREEMVGDAVIGLCANVLRYDESKDTSAFAYITTIATNEMIKRLKSEKRAQAVRDNMLEGAGAAPSMARQLAGELARFEPVKLVRTKRRPRHIEADRFRRISGIVSASLSITSVARVASIAPATVARLARLGGTVAVQSVAIGEAQKPPKRRKRAVTPPKPLRSRGTILATVRIDGRARVETIAIDPVGLVAATVVVGMRARCKTKLVIVKATVPNGPRPKRSAEAIAASAAKLREQRQARVDAVLPLVEEARANGCQLLSEICAYLDRIGHKPPQGPRWAVPTLSNMLPRPTDADREARDSAFAALIEQARSEGAASHGEVAVWLNQRNHRTARGAKWAQPNIARFLRERRNGQASCFL